MLTISILFVSFLCHKVDAIQLQDAVVWGNAKLCYSFYSKL